jgi:4-hydroxybutyryl-CoA dehydratase/vinylacetyl-CoA-Delta-isomerase
MAEDIAGGILVTMPSQKDLEHPIAGKWMKKFFQGANGVTTEDRMRILRFLECMTFGTGAVGYRTESLHGAGSPQAQRIQIARYGNINNKKELAKKLAGVIK